MKSPFSFLNQVIKLIWRYNWMEKIPFYFSIDFEDYTHDLGRSIGNPKPESREKALELSYLRAQYFSERFFNGKKITFFVTGILARKSPELIKKIFNDQFKKTILKMNTLTTKLSKEKTILGAKSKHLTKELLIRRILGSVSYFVYTKSELFPEIRTNEVIEVELSDFLE